MPWGAGFVAAHAAGAVIVDPRPALPTVLQRAFTEYPHIGPVLPAIGYSAAQVAALRTTIERVDADVVVAATPVDLARLLAIDTPIIRARYEFADTAEPGLADLIDDWVRARWR